MDLRVWGTFGISVEKDEEETAAYKVKIIIHNKNAQ